MSHVNVPTHPAAGRAAIQNSPFGDLPWCHIWTVAPRVFLALVKFKFCAEVRKNPVRHRAANCHGEKFSEISIVWGCKNPLN